LTPGFEVVLHNPEYTTNVRINALGLRGPLPGPKDPDGIRILGLGDSFVSAFNMAEENTFLSVAAKALLGRVGERKVEFINAGTPNYGTWHEFRQLKRLVPLLHPDMVILCVYVGNDLDNNLTPKETVVRNGLLVDPHKQKGVLPYSMRAWLQRNSMAYVFLWRAWNQVRPVFGVDPSDTLQPEKAIVSRHPAPSIEKAYQVTSGILGEFKAFGDAQKLPLLIVLIPAEFQIYPDKFNALVKKQGLDPASFELDVPQRRWTELAGAHGFQVLDLLPILRQSASGPYLYMSLDGHLSLEGNRIAGEAIAQALLTLMLSSTLGHSS
jgi:hypothetical protein